MLQIRKQQMAVFAKVMRQRFEDRMVAHLRRKFHADFAESPEPELRSLVKTAIEKAATYDVVTEDDVQRYLERMARYGAGFDKDRAFSWAGEILRTKEIDGTEKMDRIEDYEVLHGEDTP